MSPEYHCVSRPTVAEVTSVERILNFVRETGARVEIAHVSCPEVMELLRQAKKDGPAGLCRDLSPLPVPD